MPSVPVGSDEPSNAVRQTTFFNQIARNDNRVEVLEKSGVLQTDGLITQTVSNGDTTSAPSGDAVYDYVEAKRVTATAVLDFPSVASYLTQTLTITVTGAAVGDAVALGPPDTFPVGLIPSGWVSAVDTVTVQVANMTAAPIDPASASWRATVFK